ncbi:MAG: prepilin-type N-terminal cleavage/methylation domain-containing protein [Syntrophobacteraceae bacterium]
MRKQTHIHCAGTRGRRDTGTRGKGPIPLSGSVSNARRRERGFTLLEMLVSLAIGTLIIGAVMGVISESIRYKINLKEKASIQPILESAAQVILADPVKAMDGFVRLAELEGSPEVGVNLLPVALDQESEGGGKSGRLFRVMLNYKSASLEFSIIIPNK